MAYYDHSLAGPPSQITRPPWLLFLMLAAVFFFLYHDLSFSNRGINNYNPSEEDLTSLVVDGTPTHRIALLSLGFMALVSLVRHRASVRLQIHGFLGWILLSFVAWAFVSPMWAEDPALTFKRLLGFGMMCIGAVAIARRFSFREIILLTLFSTALFLAIGFSVEVVLGIFRPYASGYRFAGMLHPNGQGVDCGLLLLSGLAAADSEKHRRNIFWSCALIGFIFLVLTASRTALAATVLAIAAYSSAAWSSRAKITIVYVLGILFCVVLLVLVNISLPMLRRAVVLARDDGGDSESFNGRTEVWGEVSAYVQRRPILGYGYGGFWTPTHMSEIAGDEKWAVPDSHSAYLEYLLNLGAVGLVAYVLLLCAGLWRAFRFRRISQNTSFAFYGALLVFSVTVGLLEAGPAEPSLLMFLSMVVLAQLAFICRPEMTESATQ
jgi:exopolysaccharide production protein ExoQ